MKAKGLFLLDDSGIAGKMTWNGTHLLEQATADTHRLAECWNALKDIPTNDLMAMSEGGWFTRLYELKKQNDAIAMAKVFQLL